MPLFCISLLVLLLLPLSLSCDSRSPPSQVKSFYLTIVRTDLDNTRETIATLLQNSSCPEEQRKPRSCTPNNPDFVGTLLNLTCKMKKLRLTHTERLASLVLNSIQCPCLEKPTEEPSVRLKRRRTTRRKRNEQRKGKANRKLCKAKEILSSITECYQMLNSQQ